MLKRGVAIALLAAIAAGAWWVSSRSPAEPTSIDEPPIEPPRVVSWPDAATVSDAAVPTIALPIAPPSTFVRPAPSTPNPNIPSAADLVLQRMATMRDIVHLLEMQRLDAQERGDHEAEERLDREIAENRAEHERLRQSLATSEGI